MRLFTLTLAATLALGIGGVLPSEARDNARQQALSLDKIPNKVALAKWPKARPHTESASQKAADNVANVMKKAVKVNSAKVQNFKCGLLYSDNWDDDSPLYGAYSFTSDNINKFTNLYTHAKLPANGGAFFTEDKYYFTSYTTDDWGWDYEVTTYVVNTDTWEVEKTVDQSSLYALATDLAYDPIDQKAYGTFYSGDDDGGTYWGYIDPKTCEYKQINFISNSLVAVAANEKGEIYGITDSGDLVKIDKATGQFTTIGNTTVAPEYLQSAAFDDNGTLYWAASTTTGATGLFTVDLQTAAVTLIGQFENYEEVVALYAEPAQADAGAPAEPTDIALSFTADALNGTVSFAVPSVDNTGEALTGDVTYTITIDNTNDVTGTVTPGTTATVNISVESAGLHSFSVRLSNDKGDSKRVAVSQWIGIDKPEAVTDLTLQKTGDLQATITWTAPTKGVLDGFFDASRISYTVTRLPEGRVVATNLTETSFVDNIESDSKVYLTYKVTPYADNVAGASTTSNGLVFGHAMTTPVEFNFDTEADYNIFTVIDNNETLNLDSGMWQYTTSAQCAGYVCGTKDGDDWLITPEITLHSDRQYTFSYDVLCYSQSWPDLYDVYIGKDATIDAMTTQLVEPTTIYWEDYRTKTITITVPEDGNYNIGFHAKSEAGGGFFLVDNIKLTDSYQLKAPAAVSDLVATASPKGLMGATIKFTTPTKAVDGSDLDALKSVTVYRDGEVVETFETPALGATFTATDLLTSKGFATYTVIATNEAGNGVESEAKIWIGTDTPVQPANVSAVVVNEHPVITWEAPGTVGANGGYVNPESVSYIVYRATDGSILTKDCAELTYTDTETDVLNMEDTQSMLQYYVFAQTADGIGNNGSAFVIDGKNYTLPFKESFANGETSNLWSINGTDSDEAWNIANDWSATPQDGDGGMLLYTPYTPGVESTIVSGKIDMKEAKNSALSFYLEVMSYTNNEFAETNPDDDYIEVLAASTDNRLKNIKTIHPNSYTKGKYEKVLIPLNEFDGTDYLIIGFRYHAVAAQCPVAIDNIVVRNNYNVNMAVTSFTLPTSANVTEQFTAKVTVQNDATSDANGYTVSIKRDGEVIASQIESESLAAGESRSYQFDLTALPTWGNSETLEAAVAIANDEKDSDNSAEASISLIRPDMPAVTDLAADLTDDSANFTWSAPKISSSVSVTEDWEGYKHGAISKLGDWTLRDEDGVYGLDDIMAGDDYINFPFVAAYGQVSFMVFNPTKSDIDIEENPEWAPHSGNNMIVSFRNYEKDNDDWLISPKLSGEAQTISFYARAPKANSDKLIVYASTSDTETGSFTRLEEGRITLTTEWVKYTFELEAGTQYFAFRNSSTSGTAVMIDDIEYEAGASWAVEPVVESYNLYKDGVLVSNTTDNNITVDRVPGSYYVTVVYNVGESEASNIVEISTVGIEDIKADAINNDPIYDLYGRRVYNLQPGNIYISKGKKFIYKNL